MANIKKNFNFRNGVQVDDDNLLVTSTGLVGIGTTVPTEALDVRGNVKIIGDATITNATVGILTLTEVVPTQIIGAGVSIKSGIVTAQGAGIVTFFGDARFLQGMPTSQWEDTNAGFGVSSIYNTGGTVGIATTNPQSTLQVGDNVDGGEKGVGISSAGNINASGIVTATTFKGNFTGNVTGNVTGNLTGNTQGIHTGAVNLGDDVKATFGDSGDLEIGHIGNQNIIEDKGDGALLLRTNGSSIALQRNSGSGIANMLTAIPEQDVRLFYNGVQKFATSGVGVTITSQLDTTNLIVSGVSTLGVTTTSSGSNFSFGNHATFKDEKFLFMGDDAALVIGHHAGPGHSQIKHDSAAQDLVLAADRIRIINRAENKGLARFTEGSFVVLNYDGNEKLFTSGVGVTVYNQLDTTNIVASGVITATTELNSPLIGVGTDAPAHDIQVRKVGNAEIQVTSDTGTASITIGREPTTGNTNNAELRYGGGSGANYSSNHSLDILNYDTGNFNYYLSANNAGAVNGDFHWHRGINNARLMTLTGIGGSLGIGITTPTTPLHVLGAATITGNVILGGDLNVSGNAALNVVGDVTGTLTGNVNATSGVSTFSRIDLDINNYYEFGELSAAGVGIGTTMSNFKFAVNHEANKKFTITDSGNVGIRTDDINGNALLVNGAVVALDPIGIGTDEPRAAVDFADAGQATTGLAANRMYMIPPKVDTTQRAALVDVVSGSIIYNTTANKLQVYVGTGAYNVANWENLH